MAANLNVSNFIFKSRFGKIAIFFRETSVRYGKIQTTK